MKKRTKIIILAVVGLQIIFIIGLLTLPTAVQAVPGRYRVALAERNPFLSGMTEGVIEAVAPVATALPAPAQVDHGDEVNISALIAEPNVGEAEIEATAVPAAALLEGEEVPDRADASGTEAAAGLVWPSITASEILLTISRIALMASSLAGIG